MLRVARESSRSWRRPALRGAAVAAERLGDGARAADRWRALARNWSRADPDFPGLAEAQTRSR